MISDIFTNKVPEKAIEKPELKHVGTQHRKLTYEDFDFDKLNIYAGIDCIATSGVLSKLFPAISEIEDIEIVENGKAKKVEAPAIIESISQVEMPAHEFIIDLEINGIGYSKERNEWYDRKMAAEVAELDEKIFSAIGKNINLDSGPVVAEFLYLERGFAPPFLTKGGEPATDGVALMTLAGLDPIKPKYDKLKPELAFLANMAKRRDISSCRNTFIKTYYKDWVKRTGRIHPSYNLFGTSSFRITGSDPNLTQLPRAKHGYNVRDCYTVRDGYVFVTFDFSSAEVKILGNMSKDPAMLKAIADGLDFHTFSASAMYGIPYEIMRAIIEDEDHHLHKEYKGMRQTAKVLTFSLLYGSSAGGIAHQLSLPKQEAERLMDLYFGVYPGVKKFISSAHEMALRNQYVITPLGQRKREYGTFKCYRATAAYNAALRNAQNVLIQSTTSSVGLITFAELNNRLKPLGVDATCTVYDSIEMEVPIDRVAEVVNIAYEVLNDWPVENFDFLELPIGCDGEIGISWGELRGVHKGVTQQEVLSILDGIKTKSLAKFGF